MKKHITLFSFLSFHFALLSPQISKICNPVGICNQINETEKNSQEEFEKILKNFKPNIHITETLPEDIELYKKIEDLFFEKDHQGFTGAFAVNSQRDVYNKAIRNYGAQEIILLTKDHFRISSLFFERPDAPLNIIYVTGYFYDQTPTKEWAAPFALLFPNLNILTFDWRGYGNSKNLENKTSVNNFGTNAYPDIQAAIDYIRKNNDKPIVLIGFCAGAAMVLKTTIQAQETGENLADALVLNSIFKNFDNQFHRTIISESRWYMRLCARTGISALWLKDRLDGNLFDLKPIKMVEKIKQLPCLFEHYTDDPLAIIEEGIQVFEKTKSFKMFLQSDPGKHVRIHTAVPYQYRNAFYDFIYKSQLLRLEEIKALKLRDCEHDQ